MGGGQDGKRGNDLFYVVLIIATAMTHTILIIDDNPDDIEITKRTLAQIDRGLKAKAALRGEAAIELLQNGEALPSLILLDLKMPGMSGFEFLRKIRGDERMQHIPVIVATSSSLETDEKQSYEAGADAFLHKAFDRDKFSSDLKSLLERLLKN
jgi:two-component system response regulator